MKMQVLEMVQEKTPYNLTTKWTQAEVPRCVR